MSPSSTPPRGGTTAVWVKRDESPKAKSQTTPDKSPKSSTRRGRDRTPEKKAHKGISVDACKLIEEEEVRDVERREIYGVGRNFNRGLGSEAYRTGGEMKMLCDVATVMDILRKNIVEACQDPEHSCRLFVQGSKFWFTKMPAEELCAQILMVADSPETARSIRTRDVWEDAAPCAICVCEARENAADGTPQSVVQWLFRHDVIDGWRSLRYLFTLAYAEKTMTFDRLKHRFQLKKDQAKKTNPLVRAGKATGKALAAVALTPLALARVARIAHVNEYGERRKFYAHVVCDLETLKRIGRDEKLGPLTSVLSACFLRAYFAADPTAPRANVANAVLFNPDSPHGNHMCMKICSIARKGSTPQKTAKALARPSQAVADAWVVGVSRAYALCQLPRRMTKWIEERQKQLDFLISSLPGCDQSTPGVSDLHVCREFTTWAPNITYCLGINGSLYMDFYWEVRPCFDDACFLKVLSEAMRPTRVHTQLPSMF
jgi:hypothetical protein